MAIGVDETRARSVRWQREQDADDPSGDPAGAGEGAVRWVRSNPWMTSVVDLDPARPGGIIGLAAGRSGACVKDWIALQSNDFRAGVQVVAIDPSAPYAAGIRAALPGARIVVDHFHLVLLANTMVTAVRQRVAHAQHARRGRKVDPAWAHRRLLLRAGDQLSAAALTRLGAVLADDDPTNEIGAAWAIKELLRQLLAGNGPGRYCRATTSHRRTRFLAACVEADMPEATRLAATIERWWPEIEGFPPARGHQRPHRGPQPGHQADQARRLRVPQPGQLRKAHHVAQRDPSGRVIIGSRGGYPAKVRRAGNRTPLHNKDVLIQVETLILMRTPSPQDRKAVLAWVDYHSAGAEAVAELPRLGRW